MARLLSHQALGLPLALYLLHPSTLTDALVYAGLSIAGSTIPDIDSGVSGGHRVILHNLTACTVLALAFYSLLYYLAPGSPIPLNPERGAIAFMIGYLAHITVDAFSGGGVAVLYPFTRRRIGILGLSYDNPLYNGLVILLGALLLYAYISTSRLTLP